VGHNIPAGPALYVLVLTVQVPVRCSTDSLPAGSFATFKLKEEDSYLFQF